MVRAFTFKLPQHISLIIFILKANFRRSFSLIFDPNETCLERKNKSIHTPVFLQNVSNIKINFRDSKILIYFFYSPFSTLFMIKISFNIF